jgi:hypothetical protein
LIQWGILAILIRHKFVIYVYMSDLSGISLLEEDSDITMKAHCRRGQVEYIRDHKAVSNKTEETASILNHN